MTDLIKLQEAEKELAVSRWTLYRWIRNGQMKSLKLPGGHLRIPLAEVVRLKNLNNK